jgi:hypothetical protein
MGVLIFNSNYCEETLRPAERTLLFEGRSDQIRFDLPVPRLGK